jgi:quercetin 2,3-dioxygenase
MRQLRRGNERGHFNFGWLNTYHTFSFGDYHDPQFMGCRTLRVINEDVVAPKGGFPMHPHRDMEIITYVLSGTLEHKDSMGNGSTIRPNDVQKMSAGTGIMHSEFNPSPFEPVHLLQIWIIPEKRNLEPAYEQIKISNDEFDNGLRLIASRSGGPGVITVHQEIQLFAGRLRQTEHAEFTPWLQMARGDISLDGTPLSAGDGAMISDESTLKITAKNDSEFLLFDLG